MELAEAARLAARQIDHVVNRPLRGMQQLDALLAVGACAFVSPYINGEHLLLGRCQAVEPFLHVVRKMDEEKSGRIVWIDIVVIMRRMRAAAPLGWSDRGIGTDA